MNAFRTLVILLQLLQGLSQCALLSEESTREAAVLIRVLQQANRIPPEFRSEARNRLAEKNADVLPMILLGMKDQSEPAIALLQSAGDEIVARAVKDSVVLPVSYLEKFAAHQEQQPEARQAAIRWADFQKPGVRELFLIRHISDDVFRQEAVDAAIEVSRRQWQAGHHDISRKSLRMAFDTVHSPELAVRITEELRNMDVTVSPADHLGIVAHWRGIGPFPWSATDEFSKEWPPEEQTSDEEESCSVNNHELTWQDLKADVYGIVQTFDNLAPESEDSIVYAQTEISSETARSVELRAAAVGRLEVRINDQTVVSGDSDWARMQHDKVSTIVQMNAGKNRILVKLGAIRRNADPEEPLPPAQFSLRFVDISGKGICFQSGH